MSFLKKAGIVCCSNGLSRERNIQLKVLAGILRNAGIEPVFGPHLYARNSVFSGTAAERAADLMAFYRDSSVDGIFDVSGGDLANEILDSLDFSVIAASGKPLWGYSDLTSVLNAVYAKAGTAGYLYSPCNLTGPCSAEQDRLFSAWNSGESRELLEFPHRFLQGNQMEGLLVGGNIRCLLKLAGTPYFPDVQGKILLLESCSGTVPKMTACLSQLRQMGVFDKISGLILGTFTEMEQKHCTPSIEALVLQNVRPVLPVVKTNRIGHGPDSRAAVIGGYYELKGGAKP